MNLQSIIDKKKEAAKYMVSEITHICKSFEKRDPGSKGEHQACEYMADVLKNECGCERADIEPFKLILRMDLFHHHLRPRGNCPFVLLSSHLDNSYRCRTVHRLYGVRSV